MDNSVQEQSDNSVVNITYTQPKFWHRVMANFVDFFIFLITFISLFAGVRAIATNTSSYQHMNKRIFEIQIESGLYVKDPNDESKNIDIISYCDTYVGLYGKEFSGVSSEGEAPQGKIGKAVAAINQFIAYCNNPDVTSQARYEELLKYYNAIRLETVDNEGIHYFVKDGEDIVPNDTLAANAEKRSAYYKNIYSPFIEKKCIPFLTSNVAECRKCYRMMFNYLVFIEIPIAYAIAGILVYFVPPLFFKRGRKTLGKALYHIGLIDSRVLSPSLGRFTGRFLIFFLGELVLSILTLGIPYIISFSMMAFSKKRQGFPDYMLRLYEVDTSNNNIYLDYVDATLKNEVHGEAVDFKMEKPL